ncbi:MAG TPA: carboxypeptidase-like regulatory domain-containing protein [Puia sp.]|nr:carboxypeptidase-like regulatory domain-containing protein [Puia sp.]
MSANKHITPFSASDIEKYRKGELSAREMHDLEEAALDDPFLADAIEGLTAHADPAHDLTDLHERLNRKVTEQARRRKVVILRRRIAFAATLILLLGIGYTFFYNGGNRLNRGNRLNGGNRLNRENRLNRGSEATAARTAPPPQTDTTHTAPAAKSAPGADSIRYTFTLPKTGKKGSAPVFPNTPPASAASEVAKAYQPAPSRDSTSLSYTLNYRSAADDEVVLKKDTQSLYKFKSISGRQPDSASLAVDFSKQRAKAKGAEYFNALSTANISSGPLVLNGTVLDLQNRPLAGAFLALNGKNSYGFTTDEHGQFQLNLHPADTTRQLTVSMIGYDHASLAVNALNTFDQRDNIIHLRPSSANLDEVVVVGYGLHRNAAELSAPSVSNEKLDTLWLNAAPVVGRQAYIQYLNVAKKKLGLDSTIAGPETLSFTISRDGTLSAFKIEQSLSPAHDAGIFRLVNDGPGWRLIRGKKVRASVTVNFP